MSVLEPFFRLIDDAIGGDVLAIACLVFGSIAVFWLLCLFLFWVLRPAITQGNVIDKYRDRRWVYMLSNGMMLPIYSYPVYVLEIQDCVEGQVKRADIAVDKDFYYDCAIGDWVDLNRFV